MCGCKMLMTSDPPPCPTGKGAGVSNSAQNQNEGLPAKNCSAIMVLTEKWPTKNATCGAGNARRVRDLYDDHNDMSVDMLCAIAILLAPLPVQDRPGCGASQRAVAAKWLAGVDALSDVALGHTRHLNLMQKHFSHSIPHMACPARFLPPMSVQITYNMNLLWPSHSCIKGLKGLNEYPWQESRFANDEPPGKPQALWLQRSNFDVLSNK